MRATPGLTLFGNAGRVPCPCLLLSLTNPKRRVPYPSAPFGGWAAMMRAIPRIKWLLQPYRRGIVPLRKGSATNCHSSS